MSSFTVMLYEYKEDTLPIEFYCSADSVEDAEEQASSQYPDGEICYTTITH